MTLEILVGADPEVFVVNGNGVVVPAHTFTQGTKEDPEEIEPGYYVHFDNIALEVNMPPSRNVNEFHKHMKLSTDILEDVIGWDHDLLIESAVVLTDEQIQSMGPNVMTFRCDPEDNIWGDGGYPNQNPLVRSSGGHLHISWGTNVDRSSQEMVAQWSDAIIGLGLVHLDDPNAPLRRMMYGKPGAIRFKPYGIEYRTPSNQWLCNMEGQELAFRLAEKAVLTAEKRGPFAFYEHLDTIRDVIMRSDKVKAKELIEFFNEVL